MLSLNPDCRGGISRGLGVENSILISGCLKTKNFFESRPCVPSLDTVSYFVS